MKAFKSLLLLLVLASCNEQDATPTAPISDMFDPANATLIKSGSLAGVGHTVSGTVSVYDDAGKKVVLLDPFSSQNGPDLRVYLSKDENALSYISLGKLKSTDGKQSYEVPGNPDVKDYMYVMVWCEKFTVVFGRAQLK